VQVFSLYVDPAVPEALQDQIHLPSEGREVKDPQQAVFHLEPGDDREADVRFAARWVYALVAPFPTVVDGIRLEDFSVLWKGKATDPDFPTALFLSEQTLQAMESLFGPASDDTVHTLPANRIAAETWATQGAWAIVPFEELDPRWKVIQLDGSTPLSNTFDLETYPLSVSFVLKGPDNLFDAFLKKDPALADFLPDSNRDPGKLTVLAMTGVTALVRATAWKMDTAGILFPAQDIGELLRSADITHISNEVSFHPDCPPGDPRMDTLVFCSDPDYVDLLVEVGTDVVELTGNHVNDWGTEGLSFTLDLYDDLGMAYFAGGENLEEARKALVVEHNGNRFAFIGCNPVGLPAAWATATQPGAAPCDFEWMETEIARLKRQGILPIATFQYFESYSLQPLPGQVRDFTAMAEAGAAIVNGSQSHYPQAVEFYGEDSFIHYGLGNLFFDQMNVSGLGPGTRWEFIDRHIFYDGRHIGIELITAMLEDWSRPRLMTEDERRALLERIFEVSTWSP
jgi:poly-gamma-glutamate synthesis protein (capsule biosynthesis protein)